MYFFIITADANLQRKILRHIDKANLQMNDKEYTSKSLLIFARTRQALDMTLKN